MLREGKLLLASEHPHLPISLQIGMVNRHPLGIGQVTDLLLERPYH